MFVLFCFFFRDLFVKEETKDQLFDGVRFDELPIVHVKTSLTDTVMTLTNHTGVSAKGKVLFIFVVFGASTSFTKQRMFFFFNRKGSQAAAQLCKCTFRMIFGVTLLFSRKKTKCFLPVHLHWPPLHFPPTAQVVMAPFSVFQEEEGFKDDKKATAVASQTTAFTFGKVIFLLSVAE